MRRVEGEEVRGLQQGNMTHKILKSQEILQDLEDFKKISE